MEYAIGFAAAIAVGLFASVIGFDKERSFYPVVLIVIATLYLLFAAMAGSTGSLIAEAIPALMFVTMAALGFRKSPWLVVVGLALHGVFDFFHHAMIANPAVPVWWPGWCLAYDVVAAAYLAALIIIRRASHPEYDYGGFEGLKKAASSGDARAQFILGYAYGNGQYGLIPDYAEAVTWYRKAAEQNHGTAQLNLGVCLAEGKGVEKNVVEGLMWILLARHVLAQNSAGWLLRDAAIQAISRTKAQMTEQQIAEANVMLDSSPLYKEFKEMLSGFYQAVAPSVSQPAPEKSPAAQP